MPSTKRKLADRGAAASGEGDEYEEVPLEGGGYRRRRVGAKGWQYHCEHGRQCSKCKEWLPAGSPPASPPTTCDINAFPTSV